MVVYGGRLKPLHGQRSSQVASWYIVRNSQFFVEYIPRMHDAIRSGIEACIQVLYDVLRHFVPNLQSTFLYFVQTCGMPNSPSQMIKDMLDWREIWGSGSPRKGRNSAETVLWHPCHVEKLHGWNPIKERPQPLCNCMCSQLLNDH
ncbi:hypothetical protein TNCV_1900571 [Trichonephila clavipes]|nr:hypothetical protein TNCV_1900571 [Trichonephila clavipes]